MLKALSVKPVLNLSALALLLLVFATACGPAATPTPRPVTPQPTAAPTQVPPTVAPTATPVPPTSTPVPPQATAKQQVNLRQGPSDKFAIAGRMPKDTTAVVIGKSDDGKWLQLAYPDPAHPSWVLASFVNLTGALDAVAVVVPTATPTRAPGTPAATRIAQATATKAATAIPPLPAPRGVLGFVSYEPVIQAYNVNNYSFADKSFAPFKQLSLQPGDITSSTNAPPFSWSASGARSAYVHGPLGAIDFLKVTDGAGNELASFGHAHVFSPSWGPGGQELAYIGMEVNGAQNIIVVGTDLKRDEGRKVAARESGGKRESFRGLAWGKFIYFGSDLSGAFEIYRMNGDFNVASAVAITNDKRENGAPAGSPDGTKVAYYSKQADNSYQIIVANADGSSPRKLTTSGNNFTPTWSPDGNWIAYFSSSVGDIMIMDKNGNNNQQLAKCQPAQRCQLPGSWR